MRFIYLFFMSIGSKSTLNQYFNTSAWNRGQEYKCVGIGYRHESDAVCWKSPCGLVPETFCQHFLNASGSYSGGN